eukprot:TRINITY_DN1024_c0_g1_i1.p1 TRINITY_DN1024_c0_g1~~TRINITY_DN1024_c0_g1_i1.p1  ORF type:complete len:121 (+),score=32.51 TRINITY_DN1024_c0_g1_i1:140-502(+)
MISVYNSHFAPPCVGIVVELLFKSLFKSGEPDHAHVAKLIPQFEKALATIEGILSAHKWKFIGGDEFSLADIVYMPFTYYLLATKNEQILDTTKYPLLAAWWKNVSSRKSWTDIIANTKM